MTTNHSVRGGRKAEGAAALRQFTPYPMYKDSGVEWLGEIPAHWTALPSRRLIGRVEQGWSPVAEDRLAGLDEWAVIKLSAVNKGTFVPDEHKALPAALAPDTRYEIRDGDFLLTRANTPDLVGDVCVVGGVRRGLMLCDLVYRLQLRSDRVTPTFLAYWLLSRIGRYQIEVDARGSSQSMVKVSQRHIRAWNVVLPPVDEQVAIATFLDGETASIDALVATRERLIELLQEKRTALISRAVIRGLDPNVPMKNSGVEWLAEVPAHWEVKKIKQLFRQTKRQGHSDLTVLSVYRDYGVIEKSSRDDNFNRTPEDLDSYQLVNEGDLVINKMKAWQASLGVSRLSGITSPDYVVYSPHHTESGRFLHYFLRNKLLAGVYLTMSNGIRPSQWRLEPDRFDDLAVFLPPQDEQAHIVGFLDRQAAKIDALVAKVREAIDRLKELRIALISAAVTGKIDVRQEVA